MEDASVSMYLATLRSNMPVSLGNSVGARRSAQLRIASEVMYDMCGFTQSEMSSTILVGCRITVDAQLVLGFRCCGSSRTVCARALYVALRDLRSLAPLGSSVDYVRCKMFSSVECVAVADPDLEPLVTRGYGIFGAQTVMIQLLLFAAGNAPVAGLPGGAEVACMPT
jgi:hypothetical protein